MKRITNGGGPAYPVIGNRAYYTAESSTFSGIACVGAELCFPQGGMGPSESRRRWWSVSLTSRQRPLRCCTVAVLEAGRGLGTGNGEREAERLCRYKSEKLQQSRIPRLSGSRSAGDYPKNSRQLTKLQGNPPRLIEHRNLRYVSVCFSCLLPSAPDRSESLRSRFPHHSEGSPCLA